MKLSLDTDLDTFLKVQQSLFSAKPVNPNASFQKSIMTTFVRISPPRAKQAPMKKIVPVVSQIAAVPRVIFPKTTTVLEPIRIEPLKLAQIRTIKQIKLPGLSFKLEPIKLEKPEVIVQEVEETKEVKPSALTIINPERLAGANLRHHKGSEYYSPAEMRTLAKQLGLPNTGPKHVLYQLLIDAYKKAGGQYDFEKTT